ncbi:MAG: bile acid:sodium symporter [Candidatus Uhrbacteria bacterium]|nr:bile acid:sodium symporter [Patescibacteria group bacterium]MBU1907397.1 bile acid:sodium symporter [Patescibacteria group bacterium]
MIKQLTHKLLDLVQSYLFIILIALGAGLLLPDKTVFLAPLATLFLQIIFFLTSLKLDFQEIFKHVKAWKMILAANLFMLIIFPIVVWLITQAVFPTMAVPLLLLAAMPVGMTAPLLVEVVGGRVSVALILTLTTSLLAPITIPFVISLLASTAVTVSAFTMFWSLIKVIVIPFALAQIIRRLTKKQIDPITPVFKPISLILLGLLIAGVVARQSEIILASFGATLVYQMIALTAFIAVILVAGYFVAWWRRCNERVTISVSLTLMNFTLAIYLAGEFFTDPNVLMAAVLVILPWSLLLIPYKIIVRKFVCPVK